MHDQRRNGVTNLHLYNLASSWPIYTTKWGKGERKLRILGFVLREILEMENVTWHRVVNEILELEYLGEPLKKVVLFNYEWYNPTHPGKTYKHNHYKIIKINHIKRYEKFDPFIIVQNARQVYYLSYPRRCKSN